MHEITQTLFAGNDLGREGNCLQAAVASLLDLSLDEVPHFLEASDWRDAFEDFADTQGYELQNTTIQAPNFGLAFGPSIRGVEHAVVYLDGCLAWDPHPDRLGLISVSVYVHFHPASSNH